jgi:alanyl-tRNA synthetase
MDVIPVEKRREEAITEGATALFGEKYGAIVRTISIGTTNLSTGSSKHSYELCGGTHLENTSEIGTFIIVSEGSAAAGIRRIEAVTGRCAYELVEKRFSAVKELAEILKTTEDEIAEQVGSIQEEVNTLRKRISIMKTDLANIVLTEKLDSIECVNGINILTIEIPDINKDVLAKMADKFREKFPEKGICVIVSQNEGEIIVMAAVTRDLIQHGIKAGDLVGLVSRHLGAGGGGAPHLAFGGGLEINKLPEAYRSVRVWVKSKTE